MNRLCTYFTPQVQFVVIPVEGHPGVAVAILVEHLVAAVDGDLVHLKWASRLARHQDLGGHDLKHRALMKSSVASAGTNTRPVYCMYVEESYET